MKSGFKLLSLTIYTAVVLIFMSGCGDSIYYGAMEKFGYQKRDILVDRVEEANEAQKETKEQFASALEQFSSVVKVKGGDLEKIYKKLKAELEGSEERSQDVKDRIKSVEKVAKDLFAEWEVELGQYSNAKLRASSADKLRATKVRYQQLISRMKAAEKKIDPVLTAFRDQVLYLKHNLNAKAIASIKGELAQVETDISALIKEMDISINEADAFIKSMGEK
ncbi:MAG: DUF2959 domain-containing protein [Planctomycetota bacterium]|jgi:hypothetical protein